jgi:GNAT superfamily N-acetyltransferase
MPDVATVRELAAHEWELFRALRFRALTDSPDAFATTLADARSRSDAEWREQVAATCAASTRVLFVGVRGSDPVGLVFGRLEDAAPHIAHLGAMWVDPSARGSGVGFALVHSVLAWARTRDARRIELQVTEGNANAERLYARAGFVATEETQPLRIGSPLRVRTMRLELAQR